MKCITIDVVEATKNPEIGPTYCMLCGSAQIGRQITSAAFCAIKIFLRNLVFDVLVIHLKSDLDHQICISGFSFTKLPYTGKPSRMNKCKVFHRLVDMYKNHTSKT